ncbi:prepilin peptidase [Parablautia muri]|uniref:Prepilin type IV endopeptidase peptidase domain-containing protein n=1 Tax=Parablautia muri TaxID=2320879 RepID=A0A9X5BI44_9FIRM|nr:prepilin peptidase [Parablautia muri]NBJ94188.1 hypothetical protein [Parablautia muri]
MSEIAYCIGLFFLAELSVEDIKTKEISINKVIFFIFLGFLFRLIAGEFNWNEISGCLIPGSILLLLSFLTDESIGYGDGMTVVALGLWTGGWFTAFVVWIGITLSGIWGGICLFRRKKETIPFLPFLLLGMEVAFVYA